MTLKDEYNRKLITHDEAAKLVKSEDFVTIAVGTASCSELMTEAILNRWPELHNVTISDALQIYPSRLYDPKFMGQISENITYAPCFGSVATRNINRFKVSDYLQGSPSVGADIYKELTDVFLLMVSPPNKYGFVNLGPTCFYTPGTIRQGKKSGRLRLAIAEVNDQMPIVHGDNWMHISEFDHFIEISRPLPSVPRGEPSAVEQAISQYALELIRDGDTIQMGIGGISEAVAAGLGGRRDLGILSEMMPTSLPDLVKQGIVNNSKKELHTGVSLATFCVGDKGLYDFLHDNPLTQLMPGEYTNNPRFIAQHANVVGLNTCLMVDFTGQNTCESAGHTMISGVGGQLDFMLGSYWSPGGRGVCMLASSRIDAQGNLCSNIVPEMPPGTKISVPASYAQYFITEYGIANVRYLTRRQRALALIEIAHPDLRAELRNALKSRYYPNPSKISA